MAIALALACSLRAAERDAAADDAWWSFQPPRRPHVPVVQHRDRVRTPIDAFVLERLEAHGLNLAPDADRVALARRACLDLTGLPPTPHELDAYLADASPAAYERWVDRLLDSPHYGERWARHWLDVAGYSDARGILVGEVPRPTAYLYRDYVIRALNDDKPYDRFLLEQIAGDELVDYPHVAASLIDLPSDVVDALVATGYLRNAADASRPDFVNIKHAPMYYFDTLNDTIAIVASSALGLTVHCAQCHDHKYDPIAQTEYYQLQAIFRSGYRPDQWIAEENRFIEWASDAEKARAAEHNKGIQVEIDELRAGLGQLETRYATQLFEQRLATLPDVIRDDVKQAFTASEKDRNEVQKYLVAKFQAQLKPPRDELFKAFPSYKTEAQAIENQVRATEAKKKTFTRIRAFYDLPGEPTTNLMRRGDWRSPAEEVGPGVPAALATPQPFRWTAPAAVAKTSGRRLAFAWWLTQPEHPLTARVEVNRVWSHHFGQGIVSTPEDFGHRGSPPSHPELLDWLATEFVARGWSLKALHRLIMTSTVYRQASSAAITAADALAGRAGADVRRAASSGALAPHTDTSEWAADESAQRARQIDPGNRLLWRMPLKRLEAEAIRDSVLAVSGSLNPQAFGPAVPLQTRGDGEVVAADGPEGCRRSVYLFVGRKVPVTMLHLFDQPMMSVNCTRRGSSTLSSQALDLLNSDFMVKQADAFADRVLREAAPTAYGEPGWDPAPTLNYAFRCALAREPSAQELADAAEFVRAQAVRQRDAAAAAGVAAPDALRSAQHRALADLCHMLMSANEFVYAD